MRAIILAGGEGTRLQPLTYKIPKPLIEIQGKTLTEHVFDILKKAGVTEVILSLGYMSDKIKNYFNSGKDFGLKIDYLIEEKPMGTAGPLLLLKKINCPIKETFIMVNGDNLFALDLQKMWEFNENNSGVATIALTTIEDLSSAGVVRLGGDKILEFVEKPKKEEAPSNLINAGYYIIEPEIFDYVPEVNFLMMEKDIFPILAKKGKLFGFRDDSQWFDTGTLERYKKVKKEWKGI